jgi:hypothetical protein
MAALCIVAAATLPPATYGLARSVGEPERRARVAGLLAALSPVVLLFAFVSADAVFAALGTVTAALLAARSRALSLAGAVLLGVASLFSWLLLAIGAWAVLLRWRRDDLRSAVVLAAVCATAVIVFQFALAVAYGYDPVAELQATRVVYAGSLAKIRPYWFWVLGSPVAWLALLGPPIAAGWLYALRRRQAAAIAVAAVVAVAALSGVTKAETERIWLPFVPLACVAAASVLGERRTPAVVAVLLAQSVVTSLLFQTIW